MIVAGVVAYSRYGPMRGLVLQTKLDVKHLLHVQSVVFMSAIAVKTKAPTLDPCGRGFSG